MVTTISNTFVPWHHPNANGVRDAGRGPVGKRCFFMAGTEPK
jgi:hypothetical protein